MLSGVIIGISMSLLILLTVCGNVLVCLAVCATRRLRCLTNCFIVSLAVTDLLLGMLVLPFSALSYFTEWPLGPTFCNIYTSLDVMLCTASILTLLAISLDRYLAVTMPLRYSSLVLPRRVAVAMAAVWAVSLAVSFLPIHLGWNTEDGKVQNLGPEEHGECKFELNPSYAAVDASLTFYLPLLVMCWTYYRILRIARGQARRIIHTRPHLNNNGGGDPSSTPPSALNSVTAVALREHKATVTLAAVIGAFVVCWFPYFTMFTIKGLKKQTDFPSKYPIVVWLGYANSALNPVLYAALNRDFRSAYARLLRCGYHGCGRMGRPPCPNAYTPGTMGESGGEVALLCGHTSSCRAGQGETGIIMMLQEVNQGAATASLQHANEVTVNNDRSS
ncbi:histamine H2 receptor-like isoform X2 [Esox lucius]|uniref:histamine H2 receptor-like isoform X2 n=1 Tax=Esox lucius TaxID=8010 RepID=UPI000973220C|nr:histamine H2 receptor-like isoform X2 [Esox lucius]